MEVIVMSHSQVASLLKEFLTFADQQYNSQLREFDIGTKTYELAFSDEIIDHFLEGEIE